MALFSFRCSDCGHQYDALAGGRVVGYAPDPDAERCPECKSKNIERLIGRPARLKSQEDFYQDNLCPAEDALQKENKADIEAQSEKILSGEIEIKEAGPKRYRPQCPEHLKRHSA